MYHQWAGLSFHQPEELTQARKGGATAARRIATNSRTAGIKQIAGGMVEMTIPCPPERETGTLSENF
ncbi:TPA: hypothetical protein O7139_001255 [Salmonella enterica]|nr:hypothetical protein [Salmonella enterica]HDC2559348.1 hypothetical protein [Salmonella enterica]